MRSATFLAAAALAVVAAQPAMTCTYSLPAVNGTATWDLTRPAANGEFPLVDSRDNNDSPYDYYVGFCSNILPDGCNTTCGSDGNCRSGPGPAFQVCNNAALCGNACYRLGDTAANGVFAPSFLNPAHGLNLQYTGGDNCTVTTNQGTISRARSVWLDMACYDNGGLVRAADVAEDVDCGYRIMVQTSWACPQQCPLGGFGGRLCSARGICDWDAVARTPRCFCDQGYSGADCSIRGDKGAPPVPTYGGNIAGGFFGGVFAGAALVLAFAAIKMVTSGVPFMDAFKGIFGFGPSAPGGGGSYIPAPTTATAGTDSAYVAAAASGGYAPPPAENTQTLIA